MGPLPAASTPPPRTAMRPLISIITTAFNAEATIGDTIASVQAQEYPAIEHIIVDGGSSDGTVAVARAHGDRIARLVSARDRGIYDGMNKGIALATGDVVGFLNADDVFYDAGAVGAIAAGFDAETDCVYGNLVYMDAGLTTVTRRWTSRAFRDGLFGQSWTPAHPTFYCRREAYARHGGYRLDFQIAADVELMYRFVQQHRLRSKYLDQYLVKMRAGGASNRDWHSTLIIIKEVRQGILENGGRFNLPEYLFYKLLKMRQILAAKGRADGDGHAGAGDGSHGLYRDGVLPAGAGNRAGTGGRVDAG